MVEEQALRCSVFRIGHANPPFSKENITLWSSGNVKLSKSQPYLEAQPLDVANKTNQDVEVERLRLLQNIIHYGNRAALAKIVMTSVVHATGTRLNIMEDVTALQAEWSSIFTKIAGQSTLTREGYDYMPGYHLSLLSPYAVIS